MAGQPLVEGGVAVGFGGAVLEGTGMCWKQKVGAVEEGFGPLGYEAWWRMGVGEELRENKWGSSWIVH